MQFRGEGGGGKGGSIEADTESLYIRNIEFWFFPFFFSPPLSSLFLFLLVPPVEYFVINIARWEAVEIVEERRGEENSRNQKRGSQKETVVKEGGPLACR